MRLQMAKEMAENCQRRRDRMSYKRGGGKEMRWLLEEIKRIREGWWGARGEGKIGE